MKRGQEFSEDYYENGIKSGISGYEKFRWMPERSFSEAVSISERIRFTTAIDYGCAKGFLVHALAMLGHPTIGVDISEYAITHCHPRVKSRVFLLEDGLTSSGHKADLLIAKDVLEHIPEDDIPKTFEDFANACNQAFLVIPLGDDDEFRIREYEMDRTHKTKKDEEWWIDRINESGFRLKGFSYSFGDVKEKWLGVNPHGNGFFVVERKTLLASEQDQ